VAGVAGDIAIAMEGVLVDVISHLHHFARGAL
jgi:hypothetical protein